MLWTNEVQLGQKSNVERRKAKGEPRKAEGGSFSAYIITKAASVRVRDSNSSTDADPHPSSALHPREVPSWFPLKTIRLVAIVGFPSRQTLSGNMSLTGYQPHSETVGYSFSQPHTATAAIKQHSFYPCVLHFSVGFYVPDANSAPDTRIMVAQP